MAAHVFPGVRWQRALARNANAVLGLALVVLISAASVAAPLLTASDPLALSVPNQLRPPSAQFPMGTDHLGRDLFARVLYGGRLSLLVGLLVVLLTATLGALIGLVAGMFPRLDNWVMRVMDAMMALPSILLAIAIMTVLGRRLENVVLALSVAAVPRMARLVRGSVLVIREAPFVEAAHAIGARTPAILGRHVLPNVLSPIIVQATFTFSTAVLAEAALSFLGVGPNPQIPSWGGILSEGRALIDQAPWMTIFPGVAIVLMVLGINLLGDGLRDVLDPRLRGV